MLLFMAWTVIRRYNSVRGHRTDLCLNRSVLAHLQQRFTDEYDALREVLQKGTATN